MVPITFDASSTSYVTSTFGSYSVNYTPTSTPYGILIFAINDGLDTNDIASVTYAGLNMVKLVEAKDTVSEKANVAAWFLASGSNGYGIPTGTQQVTFNAVGGSTTSDYLFIVTSITNNYGYFTRVIATGSIGEDRANPQISLAYAGQTAMAFQCIRSGLADPNSLTIPANMTSVTTYTFQNSSTRVDRQTSAGTSNLLAGYTASSDDCAMVAVAIGAIIPPTVTPSVTPTNTRTITPTISVSNTPTRTVSLTPTNTRTVTPTISITPTITPTISVTATNTPTNTPTRTQTPTISITPSPTISITRTPSTTPSISVSPSLGAGPIISDGLLLHYDISNPSSYPGSGNYIYDLSGNGYTAQVTSSLGTPKYSFYSTDNGGCWNLNGNSPGSYNGDAIALTTPYPNFNAAMGWGPGTWQLWHYFTSPSYFDSTMFILSSDNLGGPSSLSNYQYTYEGSVNAPIARVISVSTSFLSNSSGIIYGTLNNESILNKWMLLTLVRDGTTTRLYWNNAVLQWEVTTDTIWNQNLNLPTSIGARSILWDYFCMMKVGFFAGYNRALSASEISTNYYRTKTRFGV